MTASAKKPAKEKRLTVTQANAQYENTREMLEISKQANKSNDKALETIDKAVSKINVVPLQGQTAGIGSGNQTPAEAASTRVNVPSLGTLSDTSDVKLLFS